MNILYLADPGSVHDVRWITFFTKKKDIKSFLIARSHHAQNRDSMPGNSPGGVTWLGTIHDPSTVRPFADWFTAIRIRTIIRKHRIDILHILYAEPNSLWAGWKSFFGVPVIVTTRGSDILKTIPRFFDGRSLLRRIVSKKYQKALNKADYITCTSAKQIEVLRQLGVKTSATLVRTGVDFSAVERAGTSSYATGKPVVFMPRSMKPVYNHELTLEAIATLSPELQVAYTFIFVNSDTPDRAYFRMIKERSASIQADIRFLPTLSASEMLSVYQEARLVVMNPLSDGSPVSAMEAMACGVPVILPPLPYDDLFANAFFFSEWTATSLAVKMEEALRAPADDVRTRVQKSYELIKRNGNTAVELNKVYDIYKRAIHEG